MGVNKGRRFVAGGGGGGCLINGNKGRKCVTRILLDSSSISYFSLLLVLILVIISDQGVSHQKTSSALATAAVAASSSVSSGGTTTRQRWLQYQTALSNTGPLGSSSSSSSAPPTATTSSTTTTSHPILNPNNENISMTSSPPSGSTSAPTTKPLTTTKSFSSRSSSSNINSYNSNRNNYFGAAGRRRMPNPTYVDGFPDGALFENNTSVNITVPLGDTAFLRCRVKNLGERSISWVRRRDWHILTTGKVTYTNDERFHILHTEGTDDWTLQIKFIQSRDNGTYECQISTGTGIISFLVNVMIAVPEAFILGNGDEYHVEQGSTINLVCVIEKVCINYTQ
ncbi:Limbic system-associated membrane protein [Folsomia candida]|uniref:Limbic system-associated membrane protein n=1 Tax=Folsomia candida TaxID=158441 RepID=A0A226CWZ6_FOLCA|nr:Limbic system-associated membrane protein [Folsomia candida]